MFVCLGVVFCFGVGDIIDDERERDSQVNQAMQVLRRVDEHAAIVAKKIRALKSGEKASGRQKLEQAFRIAELQESVRPRVNDEEYRAIQRLGELRAVEGIDALLRRVDKRFREWSLGNLVDPIAVEALAKIGKPASRAALEALKDEQKPSRIASLLRVMILVEGKDALRRMIRTASRNEVNKDRRTRLQAALKSVEDGR